MANPTENGTLQESKEPVFSPTVSSCKLKEPSHHDRLEQEKMVPKLMYGASLDTRPDFGMTVPPVAERRREQRKASERSSFVPRLVWRAVRALFVIKEKLDGRKQYGL